MATSSRSRSTPAPPISRNPAEITTSAFTPLRPHASATACTCCLGTTTTARSTASGIASTLGYALMEWTDSADGFTGYTAPVKPCRTRLSRIW